MTCGSLEDTLYSLSQTRFVVLRLDNSLPSLNTLLSGVPGVTVLKADNKRAVVAMDRSTAQRLRLEYPDLGVEEDIQHKRYVRQM